MLPPHPLRLLAYIHNSQVKLHRTLRTTTAQRDYWGFSSETAQKYLEGRKH